MTSTVSAPQQEALWWIQQRSARKDLYNLTWRLAVGPVDPAVLSRAWQTVVDRHEALRTALVQRDGAIWQEISDRQPAELGELTWPASVGTDLFEVLARHTHQRPFALERTPLARLTLVTVGERRELLLTVHHAVLDGWSVQRVIDELATAYAAEAARPGSSAGAFDEQPVAFAGYAEAARRALTDGSWQDGIDYWVSRLSGAEPVTCATLAPDREPGADPSMDGAVVRHPLSPAARAGVLGLIDRGGMTPVAAYLAAVYTVLAGGGAGSDVAVGVAVANRTTERDERCVGYLTNVVVSTGTVKAAETLDDVVGRTRDDFWDSIEYQHVPYSVVHNALPATARDRIGAAPPVLFTYHGHIGAGVSLGGQPTELLASPSVGATNQLALGVFEGPDGPVVEAEYDAIRFEPATVREFLADLDRVLAAGQRADTPIESLDIRSHTVVGGAVSAVREEAEVAPAATDAGVGAVQRTVTELWAGTLRVADPPAEGDFFDQGGHSLQVFDLMAAIRERLGGQVDIMDWLDRPTLAHLIELTAAVVGQNQPAGAGGEALLQAGVADGPHVHLIHPAGGADHATYRDLAAALPDAWRITVSPDHEVDTIPAMAEAYADALLTWPQMPELVGGWSLGGLIGYAMALRLRKQGVTPPALVLIDPPPPDGSAFDEGHNELDSFIYTVLRGVGADHLIPTRLRLPGADVELALGVLDGLLRVVGSPLSIEALRRRFEAIRRHWRAMSTYQSAEPVNVPAVLVVAELNDADVAMWTELLGPDTVVLRVATDHYAAAKDPFAGEIAAAMVEIATPIPKGF